MTLKQTRVQPARAEFSPIEPQHGSGRWLGRRVPPYVVALSIIFAIGLIAFIGFRTVLAEPPTVHGIGRDGKPMTDAQAKAMGDAMSGGRASTPANKWSQMPAHKRK